MAAAARAQCDGDGTVPDLLTSGDDWPAFGADLGDGAKTFSIDSGNRYKWADWSGNTNGGIENTEGTIPMDAFIPFAADGQKKNYKYGVSYTAALNGLDSPDFPYLDADDTIGAYCPELAVRPVAEQGMNSASFYFNGATFLPVLKQVQGNGAIEQMTVIAWVNSSYCVPDANDQTGEEFANTGIFDLDRSEYFSFFLTPSGYVKFSSTHKNTNNIVDTEETADTSMTCPSPSSKQQFHMVAITFSCTVCGEGGLYEGSLTASEANVGVDGVKRIFRDGKLTQHDQGDYDAETDTYSFYSAIGSKMFFARYPKIGDGAHGTATTAGAPCRKENSECADNKLQMTAEKDFWKFFRDENYFLGQIGLIGWWDYAMSEAQIQGIYDRTKKYYQSCEPGSYCINAIEYPCDASYYCPGTWEVRRRLSRTFCARPDEICVRDPRRGSNAVAPTTTTMATSTV